MIRTIFILLLSICLLVSCQQKSKQYDKHDQKVQSKVELRPNIILIYVDDMGLGDASFTNGKVRPTPNIDKLATEGKIFTQYYSNAPVCSPSRVAITTGMYPQRWNINTYLSDKKHNNLCDQSDYLKANAPSLAKSLKTAGYITAHFGKWHMGGGRDVKNAPSISEYGFDEFSSTWESPNPDPALTSSNWIWAPTDSINRWDRTAYFVEKTLEFLKNNKDKPCYVNLWPDDVHTPWVPDEESLEDWRITRNSLPKLELVMDLFDRDIGQLMNGLEELEMVENTLLIFTSDNGPDPTFEYSRTNGLRGCKNSLYEGGINMPFIVRWPAKINPGQVDMESVISAVDLFPTLCKIGGAELPTSSTFDGEDFSKALLSKEKVAGNRKIFWEYGRGNPKMSIPKDSLDRSPVIAVRNDNWKCLTSFNGSKLELYNLKVDPFEKNNLAEENAEIAEKLKIEMLEWFEKTDKSAME